ncbi:hypothetical protein KHA80_14525 [Anaerobacillus sp. HL2]|nr:hypothetical protein KHA80_14525 [Anaerobacillus sp. HL2]
MFETDYRDNLQEDVEANFDAYWLHAEEQNGVSLEQRRQRKITEIYHAYQTEKLGDVV